MNKKNNKIFLLCVFLVFAIVMGCKEDNDGEQPKEILEKDLHQTWVLVEKNINGVKETLPENAEYYPYPITLIFLPDEKFRGRHDANVYEGNYEIKQNVISFVPSFLTDVGDIPWYLNYVNDELWRMNKISIFSQHSDTTNMQLRLSSQTGSIRLHFINKKWFEETCFELAEWYNY